MFGTGSAEISKAPAAADLREHIVYRMHESSLNNREAAYRIILLSIRHIPDLLDNPDTRMLFESLKENWEPLPFIEEAEGLIQTAIQLAFWLAKVPILTEIARQLLKETPIPEVLLCNALHCLLELEASDEAIEIMKEMPASALSKTKRRFLDIALLSTREPIGKVAKEALKQIKTPLEKSEIRTFLYLLRQALKKTESVVAREILTHLKKAKIPSSEKVHFDSLELWTHLLKQEWKEAYELIEKFPTKLLNQEQSPLHFPYGCLLYATEGAEIAFTHFGGVMDTPYPSTTALPSYFVTGRINEKKGWIQRAFWWEKKELYRQMDLFYKTIGKDGKTKSHR